MDLFHENHDLFNGRYHGRITLHKQGGCIIRVEALWPVIDAPMEFYLEMAGQAAEQLGGLHSVCIVGQKSGIRTGRYDLPDEFAELTLHAENGHVGLVRGKMREVWSSESGLFSIESRVDVSDIIDRMFAGTGKHYTSKLATLFAQYAGQVRPDAQTPSQYQTLSPVAMRR